MITLTDLANSIEKGLNSNTKGFDFVIIPDTGKFKKAKREGNNITFYTNGVLTTVDSESSNLTDGTVFATMTCSLKFILSIQNPNDDTTIYNAIINNSTKTVADLRTVLDNYFQASSQETMIDNEGKEYLVVGTYQFANSGIREQAQIVGNSYTLTLNLYYMFIEGGISNFDVIYTLDGKIIPFQANTANNTPTVDGYVPANTKNGLTQNLMLQSTFSVSFELPALRNTVTKTIFNSIFKRKLNSAHILSITIPALAGYSKEEDIRLVFISETTAMGETIKNIGLRATLLDAYTDYEVLSFENGNGLVVFESKEFGYIKFDSETWFYNFSSEVFGHFIKNNISDEFLVDEGDIIVATNFPINIDYEVITE